MFLQGENSLLRLTCWKTIIKPITNIYTNAKPSLIIHLMQVIMCNLKQVSNEFDLFQAVNHLFSNVIVSFERANKKPVQRTAHLLHFTGLIQLQLVPVSDGVFTKETKLAKAGLGDWANFYFWVNFSKIWAVFFWVIFYFFWAKTQKIDYFWTYFYHRPALVF